MEDALSKLGVSFRGEPLDWLTIGGTVKTQNYTFFPYKNDRTGTVDEHPVYCIDPARGGVKEGVQKLGLHDNVMTYYRGERVGDPYYIAILNAGYPHNLYSDWPKEQAYYATKMALWMYILGVSADDVGINPKYGDGDATAQKIHDTAIAIHKSGMYYGSLGAEESKITITADRPLPYLDETGQYRQQILTINASHYVGTDPNAFGYYTLSWDDPSAVPSGTRIEKEDGTDITSIMEIQVDVTNTAKIKVMYPVSATEFSVKLNATTLLPGTGLYTAYYTGDEGDANLQRYLVEADPKKETTASFTASLSVVDEPPPGDDEPPPEVPGTLRVVKLEAGTLIPLAGAVFDIKDPDGVMLYSMATDVSGTISVPVAKEGYYTITERVAPRFHTLPTHTTQGVQVRSGETAIVTFEDSPYGSLTVYKKDSADGRNLSGAVIQVKNIATGVTQTATTDSSGSATFNQLPCAADGTGYEVRELTAPQGYALDATVHTVSVRPLSEGVTSYTLTNRANPGLRILKLDRERAIAIPGVSFEVYRNGALYGEYTTNMSGEIFLPDLPAGTYTAREKSSVEPYVLDMTAQWVELTAGGGIRQLIFLNSQKSGIWLVKLDSATLKPLPNAKFRFTQISGGSYNQELITDQNGEILLSYLAPGAYEVREISVPNGYLIDDSVRTIEILAGKPDARFVFTNTKKPAIEVVKYDAQNNKYLAGATFRIAKIEDGSHYLDRVTDTAGRIKIDDLEPGVYSVQEIAAPSGYVLNTTEFHVELFPGKTSTLVVENLKKPSLIVWKYDMQTAKVLPDAEFSIAKKGGEIIYEGVIMGRLLIEKRSSAANHLPIAGVTFKVTDSSGAVIGPNNGEFVTDAAGQIILDEWLTIGSTVLVTEVSCPDDYNLDAPPQSVKIRENTTHTLTFYDSPKSGAQIIKLDSVTKQPLKGAQFKVVTPDGGVVFEGETDGDGVLLLPLLEPGWFKAIETRSPSGYVLDDTPKDFEVTSNQFIKLVFENKPLAGLQIIKLDEDTRVPIPNTQFTLSKMNGERIGGIYITDAAGVIRVSSLDDGWYTVVEAKAAKGFLLDTTPHNIEVKDGQIAVLTVTNRKASAILIHKVDSVTGKGIYGVKFLLSDANSNPLTTLESDQNGYVYLPDIPDGKYLLRELEANGYVLDTEVKTFYVRSGATTEITWKNTPQMGQIQITKKSADDNSINGFPAGTLLQGAVFGIYDRANNLVDTVMSDKNGLAVSKLLPLGRYIIRESTSPAYYSATKDAIEAEIEFSGQIVRLTVLNSSVYTNVSVTKRGYTEVVSGQSIRYDFKSIGNNSTVPLDSFYWRDTLPTDAVRLDKIITGTWSARLSYKIVYKTNLSGGTYRTLADNLSTDKNRTIPASPSALGLASNEYVTEIMFTFGRVPAGFHQVSAPYIYCNVLPGLAHEYRFTNKTDVGGLWGSQWIMANDRWVTVVYNKTTPPKLPRTGY
jgi:uncharacterized surface anchored protein